jgi:hypothetical protein
VRNFITRSVPVREFVTHQLWLCVGETDFRPEVDPLLHGGFNGDGLASGFALWLEYGSGFRPLLASCFWVVLSFFQETVYFSYDGKSLCGVFLVAG